MPQKQHSTQKYQFLKDIRPIDKYNYARAVSEYGYADHQDKQGNKQKAQTGYKNSNKAYARLSDDSQNKFRQLYTDGQIDKLYFKASAYTKSHYKESNSYSPFNKIPANDRFNYANAIANYSNSIYNKNHNNQARAKNNLKYAHESLRYLSKSSQLKLVQTYKQGKFSKLGKSANQYVNAHRKQHKNKIRYKQSRPTNNKSHQAHYTFLRNIPNKYKFNYASIINDLSYSDYANSHNKKQQGNKAYSRANKNLHYLPKKYQDEINVLSKSNKIDKLHFQAYNYVKNNAKQYFANLKKARNARKQQPQQQAPQRNANKEPWFLKNIPQNDKYNYANAIKAIGSKYYFEHKGANRSDSAQRASHWGAEAQQSKKQLSENSKKLLNKIPGYKADKMSFQARSYVKTHQPPLRPKKQQYHFEYAPKIVMKAHDKKDMNYLINDYAMRTLDVYNHTVPNDPVSIENMKKMRAIDKKKYQKLDTTDRKNLRALTNKKMNYSDIDDLFKQTTAVTDLNLVKHNYGSENDIGAQKMDIKQGNKALNKAQQELNKSGNMFANMGKQTHQNSWSDKNKQQKSDVKQATVKHPIKHIDKKQQIKAHKMKQSQQKQR